MEFLTDLYLRNPALTLFGWVSLAGAILCGALVYFTAIEVQGINAWIKPLKFYLSITIFTWSMAWFLGHLSPSAVITSYTWSTIIILAFELIYITLQAAKGELSHFNVATPYHSMMFSLMGLAISVLTLFTLYIGILFFQPLDLPEGYLWGIRLGIILFVIFAFEGGIMGAQLSHTVGAPDGGPGIKFFNWSMTHGDLRIAHFVGMHALQVLPFLGYYVFRSSWSVGIVALLYFLISAFVLVQALQAKPLFKINEIVNASQKS